MDPLSEHFSPAPRGHLHIIVEAPSRRKYSRNFSTCLSNPLYAPHFLPQLPENTLARRLHKAMVKQRKNTFLHGEFQSRSMRIALHPFL